MGYLLLAVMFYTAVRFGITVWLQLRYEMQEERRHAFALKTEYPDSK